MVRVRAVGPSSVGSEHYPESVVVEVFEAVGEAADLFDDQVESPMFVKLDPGFGQR